MSDTTELRRHRLRALLWFAVLWLGSLGVFAGLVLGLRALFGL